MNALGLSKKAPRSSAKRARMVTAAIKKLAKMKKFPNRGRKAKSPGYRKGKGYARKQLKVRRKAARLNVVRKSKSRHTNPVGSLIGTSPALHIGHRIVRLRGRLVTGPGEHRVTILSSLLAGAGKFPRSLFAGARVKAIDYRHDAKALRAYGRVAPFRHRFTTPARVLSSGGGRIVIESSSRIWEKQS
jgi:hypothetical protein